MTRPYVRLASHSAGWVFWLAAVVALLGSMPVALTSAQTGIDRERDVLPAVVQIAVRIVETENGRSEEQLVPRGSGTVISPNGVVLSANHVLDVSDLKELSAEREASFKQNNRDRTVRVVENQYVLLFSEFEEPPRPRFTAEVAQADPALDLAVLRIIGGSAGGPVDPDELDLTFVSPGDSNQVEREDRIWVIGYPGIAATALIDSGEVNTFEFEPGVPGRAWIVTDATASGGSSGGPAVNEAGQVIGVVITASELECRPGDTNRDGEIDELDIGCIPVGSSVAKLRPVNLAQPMLEQVPEYTSPTPSPAPEPTATNTPEPTATNTPEPTATNTPEPMATNTPEPTATNTPEPTATNTPEPTATNMPEPTATATVTPAVVTASTGEVIKDDQLYLFDRTVQINPNQMEERIDDRGNPVHVKPGGSDPLGAVYVLPAEGSDRATRYLPEFFGDPAATCPSELFAQETIQGNGATYVAAGPETDMNADQLTEIGTSDDGALVYAYSPEQPFEEILVDQSQGQGNVPLTRYVLTGSDGVPAPFSDGLTFAGQQFAPAPGVVTSIEGLTKVGCAGLFPVYAPAPEQPFSTITLQVGDQVVSFQTLAPTETPTPAAADAATVNIELIFDSSGSMAQEIAPGVTRIDAAKDVLNDVIKSLPEREGINVGFRVYGHEGSNQESGRQESCAASELLVPIEGVNKDQLRDAVESYQPVGWTPITLSLQEAALDFTSPGANELNAIVLVTDGLETCGGDPCAAAVDLAESETNVTTHVIGFGLTEEERSVLQCIADAGGGLSLGANSPDELDQAIETVLAELQVVGSD